MPTRCSGRSQRSLQTEASSTWKVFLIQALHHCNANEPEMRMPKKCLQCSLKNVNTCQEQLIVMLQHDKKEILPKFCQTPNDVSFQYFTQIHLLFRHYSFHDFHSPPLDDTDFDSLPLVLVIGGWPLLAQKSNLLYFNRGCKDLQKYK